MSVTTSDLNSVIRGTLVVWEEERARLEASTALHHGGGRSARQETTDYAALAGGILPMYEQGQALYGPEFITERFAESGIEAPADEVEQHRARRAMSLGLAAHYFRLPLILRDCTD